MQPLREVVHPAVFAGEPLPEGARPDASVRLQGAPQQDVRVRGVWPHHRGAGEPLHPSQGNSNVLISVSEQTRFGLIGVLRAVRYTKYFELQI